MAGVQFLSRAPDGLERCVVQIQNVDTTGVWVRVDVRTDLRAAQSQFANTTFQLARRQIGILHRNRRQARESLRMIAHDFGDVIVQPPGKIERVRRLRPIAEHHRHGREHLHGNAVAITLLDATLRIPDVVGDLAKDAVALHHPRAARLIMIEPNESAVAVLRVEIRPLASEGCACADRSSFAKSVGRFGETPISEETSPESLRSVPAGECAAAAALRRRPVSSDPSVSGLAVRPRAWPTAPA